MVVLCQMRFGALDSDQTRWSYAILRAWTAGGGSSFHGGGIVLVWMPRPEAAFTIVPERGVAGECRGEDFLSELWFLALDFTQALEYASSRP
jgi:hypothetical protein